MIHIDTDVMAHVLRDRSAGPRAKLDTMAATGVPLAISSIVLHELQFGAAISNRPTFQAERLALLLSTSGISIAPFEATDARHAADIRAALKRLGQPIGPYDLLIAAQARCAGAALVTANGREFGRVPGLNVIDWSTSVDSSPPDAGPPLA